MGEVTKYMTQEEPYNESYFQDFKSVKPLSWWKMGKRLGFEKALVDVALTLVSGVPNSAELERCFSTTGMTYGKLKTKWRLKNMARTAQTCINVFYKEYAV